MCIWETVKSVNLEFCCINNFLLEIFIPNLESLTRSSFQIWTKLRYFQFPDFWSNPWRTKIAITGIFSSTFLQPVSGSENSILNWVIMKLNLFMCFFFLLFCFETSLKDFSFYSLILFILCFRHLQIRIKESCMYLSKEFFFKILHKTLKSQEKCFFFFLKKKKAFSSDMQKFQKFSLRCLPWGHPTEPLN